MIIGLTGKKGAGKNAVARLLAGYAPLPVVEVSFARKLKESAAAMLGCTVDDLERWKNDPNAVVIVGQAIEDGWVVGGVTQPVRSFLQRCGTEGHRDIFGEDFWLDAALPLKDVYDFTPAGMAEASCRITNPAYSDALYVVTDVRFPNEAQRVKDLGGIIVRVIGPQEIENADDTHPSEASLDYMWFDAMIVNARRDDYFRALISEVRQFLERQCAELVA